MKMHLLRSIGAIFLISILTSCFGDDSTERGGIETRVFGKIFDIRNQIPVVNQKLIIGEWNSIPSWGPSQNKEFIQYLDSTTTDSNGYFDFTFTTSGQGDLYYLNYEINDSIWTYYRNPLEIEDLGDSIEVDFDFLHLYPVRLKITLDADVEHLPIRILPQFTHFSSPHWITSTNVEFTRQIYKDKNSDEEIIFSRTTSGGVYQAAKVIVPATNSTELTEFELYLSDSDFIGN